MKLLVMCEGPNELEIIKIMLENNCLTFTEDDLLGFVPYHARQIATSSAVRIALNIYPKRYDIGTMESYQEVLKEFVGR